MRSTYKMYCFKSELEMVELEMRDSLTLYATPEGLGHGKLIEVSLIHEKGRSLIA